MTAPSAGGSVLSALGRAVWGLGAGLALLALAAGPAAGQDEDLNVLTSFAEFGEPAYPPDFPYFGYVNPEAPKGGAIRLGAFGTFERLDTIVIGGTWAAGIGLTLDSLMTGSGDELSSFYPLIAESVAVPDDLSYAIFTLNPAARYHDGHPITAGDFVYAFDVIMEHGRPFLRAFYEDITGAQALDDRRIRFDFRIPDSWKTLGLAASMSPLPRHYWEAEGRDVSRTTIEPPLTSGAYRVAAVRPGSSITYERVDDYWAADLPVKVGHDNFERITYVYYRDLNAMFLSFEAGDIDFWTENRAQRWTTGYDFPAARRGDVVREVVANNVPQGIQAFIFNTRRPAFQDPRVREAIGLLFDFEWTQRTVLYGQYTRIRSYFPNSDFGVTDFPIPEGQELAFLEPFRDELPPSLFSDAFVPPETDGSGTIRPQLREARRLFQEAGWEVRDGRLVNVETGQRMRIQIVIDTPDLERLVQPFIRNLERAGIQASLRVVDTAQYSRLTDDFDFDMLSVRFNFFPPPGPEQRSYWGSAAAGERGSANYAGIRNSVVDALIEEVVAAEDLETLKAANRALDRALLWNYYVIPQYYNDEIWIAYWNIFGQPERLPYYGTGFPTVWWYDAADAATVTRQ